MPCGPEHHRQVPAGHQGGRGQWAAGLHGTEHHFLMKTVNYEGTRASAS